MENNDITFSEVMHDPEKPDRDIVAHECFRQFDVWRDMGFNVRTICDGQLISALECIVMAENADISLKFLRYAQEKAKHYEGKLLLMIEEKLKTMDEESE
jgi:hypothetical protein